MYVHTHTHTHMYIYIYTHIYIHIYIHTYIQTYIVGQNTCNVTAKIILIYICNVGDDRNATLSLS